MREYCSKRVDAIREAGLVRSSVGKTKRALTRSNIQITNRVAFVTNLCPHYRVKTFETLAKFYDINYVFYSAGGEWYWQKNHGLKTGDFRHTYLPGFQLTRGVRIVPSLIGRLWQENYDLYIKCINGRFALPITYLIARLRRKPFILWTGIWMSLETPFHRLIFPMTLWIYRHADAIVVYGDHVKRYLVSLKLAPEKIFIAAHAINNTAYNKAVPAKDKVALKSELGLEGGKVVLYLGRLEEIKGVNYLIKAFALLHHPNVSLVIAGDGSLRKELETLAQHEGVGQSTHFTGYVPYSHALGYYAIADLLVLPSVTMPTGKETWGLVVNEAMNQGVPIVATEAVGAAAGGLVRDGVNGLIVPERDSIALAHAIGGLLGNDEVRGEMSKNARKIIAAWDNERMVKGFRDAIGYVTETKLRAPSHITKNQGTTLARRHCPSWLKF